MHSIGRSPRRHCHCPHCPALHQQLLPPILLFRCICTDMFKSSLYSQASLASHYNIYQIKCKDNHKGTFPLEYNASDGFKSDRCLDVGEHWYKNYSYQLPTKTLKVIFIYFTNFA